MLPIQTKEWMPLLPIHDKGMDHSEESPIKEVKKEDSAGTENKV